MTLTSVIRFFPEPLRRHKLVQLALLLFPGWRIQVAHFNGEGRVVVDLSDPNARNYFLRRSFEPEFFRIAMPFLAEGGRMFDVGANFGFCGFGAITALAAQKLEVHFFEANPALCGYLRQSAGLYPKNAININHCCVSDRSGDSRLSIARFDLGQSFISGQGELSVRNLILDEYVAQQNIRKVAFTKIDIEGYECHALRGAKNSLKNGVLEVIYLEVSEPLLRRSGFTVEECLGPLVDAGYSLYFCKEKDLLKAKVGSVSQQVLTLGQSTLPVISVNSFDFPAGFGTDILAIHRNCGLGGSLAQR
jgi:FkbM family methyltransferase